MTQATISNWQFKVGSAASPQVLTAIEEILSMSGIGQSNELVEVTNFDSPQGTKEFIAGLADGAEFTISCNYIDGAAGQELVRTAVAAQATRLAQLVFTYPSPNASWSFSAVCQSWEMTPSPTEQNQISFGFKISGSITEA